LLSRHTPRLLISPLARAMTGQAAALFFPRL